MEENSVNSVLKAIKSECNKAKKVEGDVFENLVNAFALSKEDSEALKDVYYTKFNMIYTSPESLSQLRYIFNLKEEVIKIEIPEYDSGLFVMRYFHDTALNNILV